MNINQLKYFCAVVRLGSFTKAASDQGVSVQAVSHALVKLEEELGRDLFVRGSRGVGLTEFGSSLVGHAERAVEAFREVERAAGAARDAEATARPHASLSLGLVVPEFDQASHMCSMLSKVVSVGIGMRSEIALYPGPDALSRLREGRLDAMLTVGPYHDPSCEVLEVGTLSTGIFLHDTHPLASSGTVSLADLAPYPVCYGKGVDDFNESIVNIYHAAGMPSPMRVVTSLDELRDLAISEHGFIMAAGIPGFVPAAGWRRLKLRAEDSVPVPVCMVTPKGGASEGARRLEAFVKGGLGPLMRLL